MKVRIFHFLFFFFCEAKLTRAFSSALIKTNSFLLWDPATSRPVAITQTKTLPSFSLSLSRKSQNPESKSRGNRRDPAQKQIFPFFLRTRELGERSSFAHPKRESDQNPPRRRSKNKWEMGNGNTKCTFFIYLLKKM